MRITEDEFMLQIHTGMNHGNLVGGFTLILMGLFIASLALVMPAGRTEGYAIVSLLFSCLFGLAGCGFLLFWGHGRMTATFDKKRDHLTIRKLTGTKTYPFTGILSIVVEERREGEKDVSYSLGVETSTAGFVSISGAFSRRLEPFQEVAERLCVFLDLQKPIKHVRASAAKS